MHTYTLAALTCALAVGWVPTSLASSCPEVVYDIVPNNATGRAVLVVGLSAPFSGPHMGMGVAVRAGLEAAFARANEVSQLKFVLASLDDASDGDRHMNNTETLLCRGASGSGPAFAIAGTVGPSASEMTQTVLQMNIGPDGVPDTTKAGPGGPRTGVALARAGAGDEVNAVMAFLAHDWNVLNNTALFYEDTTMGGVFLSMADKAGGSLVPKEVVELLGRCWQKQPERRPSVFQILRNWPQTFASAGVFEVPSDISVSSPGTRQMFSEIQTDVDVVQGPQEGFDEMMVAVVPQQLSAQDGSFMQGGVDLALASFSFSTGTPKGIDSESRSSIV
eukprot:m51a1_g11235 hypothetical protein (334) ;mRNA; r:9247-12589